jgi:hypothetical protein
MRDLLVSLGVEWVMQGTGDQHISYQQVLSQPQKFVPFIISFVPEKPAPGRRVIGFAQDYLDRISPNIVRDQFAEASFKAYLDRAKTNNGFASFLRITQDDDAIGELRAAFKGVYSDLADKMENIHKKNMDLLPVIPESKVLYHLIPMEMVPISLIKRDLVKEIQRGQTGSREVIEFVYSHNMAQRMLALSLDTANIVDIALTSRDQLSLVPSNVKALVFEGEREDMNTFKQLEGVLAALRAIHSGNTDALLSIYAILTGEKYTGDIADLTANLDNPKELAKYIVFHLRPVTVVDIDELRVLNERLIQLLVAA